MKCHLPHLIFGFLCWFSGCFLYSKNCCKLALLHHNCREHLFSNDPSKSYQLVEAKLRIVCTVGTLAGELQSTDESKWLKKLAELRADPFFGTAKASGKISQLFFEAPHHKAYTGPRGANHGYPWHNSPTWCSTARKSPAHFRSSTNSWYSCASIARVTSKKKLKEIEPNKKSNIKHVSFYISLHLNSPPGKYNIKIYKYLHHHHIRDTPR